MLTGGRPRLRLDEDVEFYRADIAIEARTLGAKARLTARAGAFEATCNVVVTHDEAGPGLKVEIADMDAGHRRALVEQSGEHVVIRIMGRHPAVRRYLGPGREFPGQELCVSRAMVAEIVAAEAYGAQVRARCCGHH